MEEGKEISIKVQRETEKVSYLYRLKPKLHIKALTFLKKGVFYGEALDHINFSLQKLKKTETDSESETDEREEMVLDESETDKRDDRGEVVLEEM